LQLFNLILTALLLLALGVALRVARGGRASTRERCVGGLQSGLFDGLTREVEIGTGFVASVLAGIAVAGNASAANAIAGWFTSAAGLSSGATAIVTVAFIAAVGTVLTDVARGGISRAIRESLATPTRS